MSKLKIAVIPGDGIGWEVIPEGLKVLEAVGRKYNIEYSFTELIGDVNDTIRQEN